MDTCSVFILLIVLLILGHLKVVFDFGFERQELIFPNKHFGLGQYHDVRLTRKNAGATMILTVSSLHILFIIFIDCI